MEAGAHLRSSACQRVNQAAVAVPVARAARLNDQLGHAVKRERRLLATQEIDRCLGGEVLLEPQPQKTCANELLQRVGTGKVTARRLEARRHWREFKVGPGDCHLRRVAHNLIGRYDGGVGRHAEDAAITRVVLHGCIRQAVQRPLNRHRRWDAAAEVGSNEVHLLWRHVG